MPTDHRKALANIKRLDQLVVYLRDELNWPIVRDSFEEIDDLFFDFSPAELGIDRANAAKIEEIKRLRPLSAQQPWGIFFVKFEPKRLPVVALRRILGQVALKKRSSANRADRQAWSPNDLLFISNYGEGNERQIALAHFSAPDGSSDLPALKVLGWNNQDTALRLDDVAAQLTGKLSWPDDESDVDAWRSQWRSAFTLGHREVIHTAQELSLKLAELARNIRYSIKGALLIENDKGPLRGLMRSFQESLVHDLDEDGFADTYAQTIAYGLLSARMVDPSKKTADDLVTNLHTSPFLKEMLETFLRLGGRKGKAGQPGIDFDELGVRDVIELLDRSNMEAVLKDFGDRNQNEDPVMHFFEGFLQAYDKKIRKDRGVFYTPQPVVSYIVRSVHELLQTEFGLADGLADTTTWGEMLKKHPGLKLPPLTDEPGEKRTISPDKPFVQILDPATGTGTFLVEVIDLIYKSLVGKWRAQGHSERKIDALWNEYVPEHLLTRLYGYELLMAPYAIAHLKIGLKLYETRYCFGSDERARIYLTNALEPAQDFSGQFAFAIPALAHESEAVNTIKNRTRFTVIIGNPPYSILSGNLSPEHRALVDRYRFVDGERIKERGALQFEKNIQDDYVKFFALAENALSPSKAAVLAYVSNANYLDASTLRGLRASLVERFSLIRLTDLHGDGTGTVVPNSHGQDENVFDILQGVAVGLYCRRPGLVPQIQRFDLGGTRESKFHYLAQRSFDVDHAQIIRPAAPYYEFSAKVSSGAFWETWPRMNEVFRQYSAGIITARDEVVISHDREALIRKVTHMRTSTLPDKQFHDHFSIPEKKGWNVANARSQLRSVRDVSKEVQIVAYRPFDSRFILYHQSLVWGRAYPTMRHALATDNLLLAVCKQLHKRTDPWRHVFVCRTLGESSLVSNKSKEVTSFFPLLLADPENGLLQGGVSLNVVNLQTCLPALDLDPAQPNRLKEAIAGYVYAILNAPSYRDRFRDNLAREFPRIPITQNRALFRVLAHLGGKLVALHLLESPALDRPITEYVGARSTEVEKVSWAKSTVWLDKAQTTGFKGVREEVWNFHIGAYRVCEKWLKDRKGQTLTDEDIAHYHKVVISLSETIRLMAEIDQVIESHGGWPGAFTNEKKTKS